MYTRRGFTLVELVIVIVLTGILASVLARIIGGPVQGAIDAERRARIVDVAQTALARMTREMRLSLPNSVRVTSSGNVRAIEFLRILEGNRYRARLTGGSVPGCADPPGLGQGDPLEFSSGCNDTTFDVLGQLQRFADIDTGANCLNNDGDCVVIFNLDQNGADAYSNDNVATISAKSDNTADDGSDQLTLTNGSLTGGQPAFPRHSPQHRFYIVDTAVSFVCDMDTGIVTRHDNYLVTAAQTTTPGGDSAVLVTDATFCQFDYAAGSNTRGGIATLRLRLTETALNETIELLQQVHVRNQP